MLSKCETCLFCASEPYGTNFGCAVNPGYWVMWKRLQSLPEGMTGQLPIEDCRDYQKRPAPMSTAEKLVGIWDYQVSFVRTCYQLQIVNRNEKLIGHYVVPRDNDSMFEIAVYESSERGRPLITMAQIAQSIPNSNYRAVMIGRLDRDRSITGSFVDMEDRRGTFTMLKQ
jgi:hypothetical protein